VVCSEVFELSTGCALWGKPATASGLHTGGEVAVADTLRSLPGLGAFTLSFAQKILVLGHQQKFDREGEFDLIDLWCLRQFARMRLLYGSLRGEPDAASGWADRLGLATDYYRRFPTQGEFLTLFEGVQARLNAPLTTPVSAYDQLAEGRYGNSRPPSAAGLPFADLLPQPNGSQIPRL